MPVDYSFLQGAAPSQPEQNSDTGGKVTVTIRVDADCFLQCDGEFVDVQLVAGKIARTELLAGQHLLEFMSVEDINIKVEKVVDFPTAGKSYLVVVNELKALVAPPAPKTPKIPSDPEKLVHNEKKNAENSQEVKRKAEEERKHKGPSDEVTSYFRQKWAEQQAAMRKKYDSDLDMAKYLKINAEYETLYREIRKGAQTVEEIELVLSKDKSISELTKEYEELKAKVAKK